MILESVLAGIAGLIGGSFLNVCIYRLPNDLSVVRPRSFCPACKHGIAWYDNIPVVSYFLLGRRCRHCGARISLRYPAVEALTALLFFAVVYALGVTADSVKLCLLLALLVGLAFSDLEERILPDEFTLGGAGMGIVLAWFIPLDAQPEDYGIAHVLLWGRGWSEPWLSIAESVCGALVPAGFLWLGGMLFEKIRHKEGLGLGDVKMVGMVGAFLGLRGALLTLILGSVAGSVIGLTYIRATKKDAGTYQLPFGTFLAFAGILVALAGEKVIRWYTGLY